MAQPRRPVPVHIVTGALGSGKTTFIQALLKTKPASERWALVVNEFGAVGIDQAVLEAAAAEQEGGIKVRELAGGCMCCTLSGVTSVAIAQLLRATKPDRLWIEPSGLGHPASLVDVLQGEHLAPALALQPIVCLVDAVQFRPARLPWGAEPAFLENQLCRDQVSIADVLVGSKADAAGAVALSGFRSWAAKLYPPKRRVLTAAHGVIDLKAAGLEDATLALGALSIAASEPAAAAPSEAAPDAEQPSSSAADGPEQREQQQQVGAWDGASALLGGTLPAARVRSPDSGAGRLWLSSAAPAGPTPGRPERKETRDEGQQMLACGWIFHRDDTFDHQHLQRFLQLSQTLATRVKGVFRVSLKTWVSAAAGAGSSGSGSGEEGVALQEIAYRRDSRLELIVPLQQPEAGGAENGGPSGIPEAAQGGNGGSEGEPGGGGTELQAGRLAEAIELGRQGDWSALEALVLALLQQKE